MLKVCSSSSKMIKGTSINYIGEGGLQRRITLQGIGGRVRFYSPIKFKGTKRVDGVEFLGWK
jgi:hypothetical protein